MRNNAKVCEGVSAASSPVVVANSLPLSDSKKSRKRKFTSTFVSVPLAN